ncbi:hypothetical protein Syun_001005 [Stephania yunnanensis]|uniref:Uncharacterized protein n=1 Tax=Stephania yunnanensis TaxID=152371 RepID=A0AAP0Q629_9MAGN
MNQMKINPFSPLSFSFLFLSSSSMCVLSVRSLFSFSLSLFLSAFSPPRRAQLSRSPSRLAHGITRRRAHASASASRFRDSGRATDRLATGDLATAVARPANSRFRDSALRRATGRQQLAPPIFGD